MLKSHNLIKQTNHARSQTKIGGISNTHLAKMSPFEKKKNDTAGKMKRQDDYLDNLIYQTAEPFDSNLRLTDS